MIMMNCFCRMVDWRKAFTPYSQLWPLSEILTIANLWHIASRVWTCAESESRLCWIKLCSSDNQYTMETLLTFLALLPYSSIIKIKKKNVNISQAIASEACRAFGGKVWLTNEQRIQKELHQRDINRLEQKIKTLEKTRKFRWRICKQHDENRGKEQCKLCSERQCFKTKIN